MASITDYGRLAALIAECDDDTKLIEIITPVIASMAKARRNQLLQSNPVRDPRKYDRCPDCGGDIQRGYRHICTAASS
jgi:hypothetical protein